MPQPGPEIMRNKGDLVIMVFTSLLFAIFIVGLASVCYRWSSRQLSSLERSVSERELQRTSRGIDAAIVKSFQTFLYSEVKEKRIGKGGSECAVCLCEFQDDDTLSLMPSCSHVYHSGCVNVWLSDHSTCPLCRVDLAFQPGEADPELGVMDNTTDANLFERMTSTNRNRAYGQMSLRLSRSRVSDIFCPRSNSTGHFLFQPLENVDRFTLRLPPDVRSRLMKKPVVRTQVRRPCGLYRSRSVGCEMYGPDELRLLRLIMDRHLKNSRPFCSL
ncbi:unnamed protein product [Eruca vesicaria subsp. sativa]|uniref:RING-type E3 ubiquitin transferase n=1 Tax=Eruca vesicaria subsp. sativa TaxID=29727 RepID=A0ABC8KHL3_ERUVS|nr:unnamed protein product [Eruca vesicaria subsp. sativa]